MTTRTTTRTITAAANPRLISYESRVKLTGAVILACLAMVAFYAMNVYAVIMRTVAIEKADSRAAAVGSVIDSLDRQYLSLSSAVTPDALSSYGLSQGKASVFIPKAAATASLGALAASGHEL